MSNRQCRASRCRPVIAVMRDGKESRRIVKGTPTRGITGWNLQKHRRLSGQPAWGRVRIGVTEYPTLPLKRENLLHRIDKTAAGRLAEEHWCHESELRIAPTYTTGG